MANISVLQSQKKVKKLIPVIMGAVLLGVIMLFVVLQGGTEGPEAFEGSEAEAQLLQSRVGEIKRGVTLPEGFFGSDVLGQFTPYDPIEAPDSWGREDPFVPFNPSEFVEEETQEEEPAPDQDGQEEEPEETEEVEEEPSV